MNRDIIKVVRQEILKAQKTPKNELLEKEHGENKLTFNIIYYPAFP